MRGVRVQGSAVTTSDWEKSCVVSFSDSAGDGEKLERGKTYQAERKVAARVLYFMTSRAS